MRVICEERVDTNAEESEFLVYAFDFEGTVECFCVFSPKLRL